MGQNRPPATTEFSHMAGSGESERRENIIDEFVGLAGPDELERIFAELFSIADGDVERGHGRVP